jgi:hypothetical protein
MTPLPTKREKPLDYFLRLLISGEIRFLDLVRVYIVYLENERKENREQIVESATLLVMHDKPSFNQGTKKQLKDRTKKAIVNAKIFENYD